MGRQSYSNRSEAGHLKQISAWWLKKYGYLNSGWRSGSIVWTSGWDNTKSSVGITISIGEQENYLQIWYSQTDTHTGEKKDFDYKVQLTTTYCRFGGKRYWFICPLAKNGQYCGRRVGVLYKDGDYFGCRHCYDLTYESRKVTGLQKRFGKIISIPELEESEKEVKRTHYNGRITKRYKRYLDKERKAKIAFYGAMAVLEHHTKRGGKLSEIMLQ